jgi:N-acetylmuramoyl-L-alanine amidase
MYKRYLLLFCICALVAVPMTGYAAQTQSSFGKGVLKLGATGGDVYELQGRLKFLGYYTGPVDGKFRDRTYRAVRLFQYAFGIDVDGTVGPRTKRKLWEATRVWVPGLENRIFKKGDEGGYVWELQRRLRFIGFYTGRVDGKFQDRTERAVRLFQYEFGLKVDGRVGPETKLKMWKATRYWRPGAKVGAGKVRRTPMTRIKPMSKVPQSNAGLSKQDIRIMAQAVHAEARGESFVGKVAVAAVILNRMESERFPNSPSGIIFQPMAFTCVADGQIWLEPDKESVKAVYDALNGWDPTGGALYYFNPATATSGWIWSRPQVKQIGKHIFTR